MKLLYFSIRYIYLDTFVLYHFYTFPVIRFKLYTYNIYIYNLRNCNYNLQKVVISDDLSKPSIASLSSLFPQGGAKEGLTAVLPMDGLGTADARAEGAESEAGSTSEESSGGDGVGWLDGLVGWLVGWLVG